MTKALHLSDNKAGLQRTEVLAGAVTGGQVQVHDHHGPAYCQIPEADDLRLLRLLDDVREHMGHLFQRHEQVGVPFPSEQVSDCPLRFGLDNEPPGLPHDCELTAERPRALPDPGGLEAGGSKERDQKVVVNTRRHLLQARNVAGEREQLTDDDVLSVAPGSDRHRQLPNAGDHGGRRLLRLDSPRRPATQALRFRVGVCLLVLGDHCCCRANLAVNAEEGQAEAARCPR